jgi:hypothetical protein
VKEMERKHDRRAGICFFTSPIRTGHADPGSVGLVWLLLT